MLVEAHTEGARRSFTRAADFFAPIARLGTEYLHTRWEPGWSGAYLQFEHACLTLLIPLGCFVSAVLAVWSQSPGFSAMKTRKQFEGDYELLNWHSEDSMGERNGRIAEHAGVRSEVYYAVRHPQPLLLVKDGLDWGLNWRPAHQGLVMHNMNSCQAQKSSHCPCRGPGAGSDRSGGRGSPTTFLGKSCEFSSPAC